MVLTDNWCQWTQNIVSSAIPGNVGLDWVRKIAEPAGNIRLLLLIPFLTTSFYLGFLWLYLKNISKKKQNKTLLCRLLLLMIFFFTATEPNKNLNWYQRLGCCCDGVGHVAFVLWTLLWQESGCFWSFRLNRNWVHLIKCLMECGTGLISMLRGIKVIKAWVLKL